MGENDFNRFWWLLSAHSNWIIWVFSSKRILPGVSQDSPLLSPWNTAPGNHCNQLSNRKRNGMSLWGSPGWVTADWHKPISCPQESRWGTHKPYTTSRIKNILLRLVDSIDFQPARNFLVGKFLTVALWNDPVGQCLMCIMLIGTALFWLVNVEVRAKAAAMLCTTRFWAVFFGHFGLLSCKSVFLERVQHHSSGQALGGVC